MAQDLLEANMLDFDIFYALHCKQLLTTATNIFTNLNMTDMETGYKLFKKIVLGRYSSWNMSLELNQK